nr:Coat Protein [Ipomoea batatas]
MIISTIRGNRTCARRTLLTRPLDNDRDQNVVDANVVSNQLLLVTLKENLRQVFTFVMTAYLKCKLHHWQQMSFAEVDAEVTQLVPIIVNACMATLYTTPHSIHTKLQEWPVLLVMRVDQLTPTKNTKNECQSTQNWLSYIYLHPILKYAWNPSVNPQACDGSLWWTGKVSFADIHFDYKCIFPPSNYSSHTVILATIFAQTNQAGDAALPIITHPADQTTYATRL